MNPTTATNRGESFRGSTCVAAAVRSSNPLGLSAFTMYSRPAFAVVLQSRINRSDEV
jgi:hypothetical protein